MSGWYYRKSNWLGGETTEGPLTDSEIATLCHDAKLVRGTLVSHPRFTSGQWVVVESIVPLAKAMETGERERETEKQRIADEKAAEQARIKAEREAIRHGQEQAKLLAREEQQRQAMAMAYHAPAQFAPVMPAPMYVQDPYTGQVVQVPQAPIVIVNQGRESQAVPAIANFFVPGLGHLIQGLTGEGTLYFVAFLAALASVFFCVGFVLVPIVVIAAVVDAARFVPQG